MATKRTFPWEDQVVAVDDEGDDSSSSYSSSSSDSIRINGSPPPPPPPHPHAIPTATPNDIPIPDFHPPPILLHMTSQDVLLRRAEMYQNFMKQIPIPSLRGSVIPFNTWRGLGTSMKELYGQPLHYLTNVLLQQWDKLRIGSKDEFIPLDYIIHPSKAETSIWLMEEVHRLTASPANIAEQWKMDPMFEGFIDSIFPSELKS